MKTVLLLPVLLFLCAGLMAQNETTKHPWKFHSINQVGLLNGERGTALQLQTVNGFQYKQTFLGLGVGLDYYQKRTVPLFLELKNYFGKGRNKFFVYGDGGVNFAWEKTTVPSQYSNTYKPGFYCNAGFGYLVGFANGMGLQLNAGYSFKKINNKQELKSCPLGGPCYTQSDVYEYSYNRLLLQIGWMF